MHPLSIEPCAQLILRSVQLRLSGIDARPGTQEILLGSVEIGTRCPSVFHQLLLSGECEAGLGQLRFGCREVRLRRAQGVLLILRIDSRDHLAGREHIAHVDGPVDRASVKAEGEADLILCTNLPGQRNCLAQRTPLDGDGPDGPRLGGRGLRLFTSGGGYDDERGDQSFGFEHERCLSRASEKKAGPLFRPFETRLLILELNL